ncbi:hypothetical protein B0H14DRAFT_2624172 [Mycena olivaceomarginata]|nr:hypothetical protein B0H14DRAFT_2624172 [Mycena olivaceomarginata]
MYPWDEGRQEMSLIMFPPEAVTLRNPNILNSFFASPAQCTICLKPHLSHQAIPGALFTIIVSCPHHTDVAQSPPGPNRAVTNLLPDQRKHETCNGNLMVFKHTISNNPAVSNQDLPVVDVLPADFLHIDELNQIKLDLDKTTRYLREGLTRCYSMVTLDTPLPLYDLDKIIAGLTLDASSLSWTPRTPSCNAPSTATTYIYYSPGRSGVSNAWSEAGHATQGVSHSSVHAVAKSNPRHPKSKAYIVFRGLHVGVFENWCISQWGYASRAAAQAAFTLAQANNWTCVLPTTCSSFAAPTGLTWEPRADNKLLCPHERNDRCVECQLNVLGVQGAVYDSTSSYQEARLKFTDAWHRSEAKKKEPCMRNAIRYKLVRFWEATRSWFREPALKLLPACINAVKIGLDLYDMIL